MAKNELSPGWLHNTDSMFRGIGDLYTNTGVEQRSYKKLGYSDRVFDTLARILQVHGPCCAVLPLIDHSVSPVAGTPIKKLYFGFNSNITNKDTTRLLD
ncbi:MAG: hypothetical protein WCG32_05905, partial [Actinomycetes bacterium]